MRTVLGVSEGVLGLLVGLVLLLVVLVLVAAIAPPLAGLAIVALPVIALVWLVRWIHPPPRAR